MMSEYPQEVIDTLRNMVAIQRSTIEAQKNIITTQDQTIAALKELVELLKGG